MKKFYLILILLIIISIDKVNALELCTPSDEYLEYQKLSDEEKAKYIEPIYCKEVLENNNNYKSQAYVQSFSDGVKNAFIMDDIGNPTILDSRYSAVENGYVTPSENQYGIGLCWGFSAFGAVESNALKNNVGTYNFSEAHLAYSLLGQLYNDSLGLNGRYDRDFNAGKIYYAPSYFFGDYGQLNESEMPFTSRLNSARTSMNKINSSNYSKGRKMISVSDFYLNNLSVASQCSTNEIYDIKSRILQYGSVQTTMYFDSSLFHDSAKDYYIFPSVNANGANHGVLIVGWDDTISKDNFTGAEHDGAWIVKNSYGSDWSNDGLFYVSYDDYYICKVTAAFDGVSTKTFDNIYSAAELIGKIKFNISGTFYLSSKFQKQSNSDESLKRVTVPVGEGMEYTVYLSKSNNKSSRDDWQLLGAGYSIDYGLRSVDIDSSIDLSDDFTIIVKYTVSNGTSAGLLLMCSEDDTSHLPIAQNTNFIGSGVNNWIDLGNITVENTLNHCEPNLYAYTDIASSYNSSIDLAIKSNVTNMAINSSNINVAVAKGVTFNYQTLINSIETSETVEVYDTNNTKVTSTTASVGTGYTLRVGSTNYTIVIRGDVTGDGIVNSGDLLAIVKKLKNKLTFSDAQTKAADATKDNNINSGDLLAIVKYLKGTLTIEV